MSFRSQSAAYSTMCKLRVISCLETLGCRLEVVTVPVCVIHGGSGKGTGDACISKQVLNFESNHFLYQNQLKVFFHLELSLCTYSTAAHKLVRPVCQRLKLLHKHCVWPHLSSVPKFLMEKLRGCVDPVDGPLAGWTGSVSMAKSLRTCSMLSPRCSKQKASEQDDNTAQLSPGLLSQ